MALPDTYRISPLERYRGCLLGGAVGDALGAAVEFDDLATIRRRFGAKGILEPAEAYGRIGAVTDDTQMTLFTAEGILQADDRGEPDAADRPATIWFAYQRWLVTQGEQSPSTQDPTRLEHGELHRLPELNCRRAPGTTCISALKQGLDLNAGNLLAPNNSKGCGGVMRAAPCGLITGPHDDAPFRLGVASAHLTHGHPSGHLAAGALAAIVRLLCDGRPLDAAVAGAIETVRREKGAIEVLRALTHAQELATQTAGRRTVTPLGQGWIAEEALAIAVYCALVHPDDLAAALRLAANHSGDSDSTAAITGNILGTHLGARAIPARWLEVLELRDTIDRLATAMYDRLVDGRQDIDWVIGSSR